MESMSNKIPQKIHGDKIRLYNYNTVVDVDE
jgi:hypothetical protein